MKVTIPVIDPGAARDVAPVNAAWAAIEAASSAVDAYNLAEEGLDFRAFTADTSGSRLELITETTRDTTLSLAAAFTTFTHNATSFRTASPLVTLPVNSALRVISSVHFHSVDGGGSEFGILAGTQFGMRHVWKLNGGGTAVIPASEHFFWTGAPGVTSHLHGNVLIESWFVPTIPTAVEWVELQYQLDIANQVRPTVSSFMVDVFKNVTVEVS